MEGGCHARLPEPRAQEPGEPARNGGAVRGRTRPRAPVLIGGAATVGVENKEIRRLKSQSGSRSVCRNEPSLHSRNQRRVCRTFLMAVTLAGILSCTNPLPSGVKFRV